MSRAALFALACALASTLLWLLWLWNLAHVPMLANDDAFVFLRYARNWVEHGSLEWNAGEPGTDGYTSFLHLALLAALHAPFRGDLAATAWLLCAALALATLGLAFALPVARALRGGGPLLPGVLAAALAAGAAVALSPQAAYWTHSLMDTTLLGLTALLGAWGAAQLLAAPSPRLRGALAAGGALALLSLARPEGMLVAAVVGVLVGVRVARARGAAQRSVAAGLALLALVAGGHFTWHLARYGHAFPNPVYVKTAGLRLDALARGATYVARGPAAGNLPTGLTTASGARIPGPRVQAAINPDPRGLAPRALLGLLPLLWIASFVPGAWRRASDARWLRAFLLVPSGLVGIAVLAGGDFFYAGWRMLTPVLPAIGVAGACAVPALRSRAAVLVGVALLALPAARGLALAPARPALCRAAGGACGWAAVRSWPVTLETYAWDHTHAVQDQQLASALIDTFPPDTRIGQSDFLRIAALVPFPVLDLSGLVNAELAHGDHAPGVSLFSPRQLLEYEPDVHFLWWGFVSDRKLAATGLRDEARHRVLLPPPREYPRGIERRFAELARLYVGASVALEDGRWFNFLVHRDAVPRMRRRDRIELEDAS